MAISHELFKWNKGKKKKVERSQGCETTVSARNGGRSVSQALRCLLPGDEVNAITKPSACCILENV